MCDYFFLSFPFLLLLFNFPFILSPPSFFSTLFIYICPLLSFFLYWRQEKKDKRWAKTEDFFPVEKKTDRHLKTKCKINKKRKKKILNKIKFGDVNLSSLSVFFVDFKLAMEIKIQPPTKRAQQTLPIHTLMLDNYSLVSDYSINFDKFW